MKKLLIIAVLFAAFLGLSTVVFAQDTDPANGIDTTETQINDEEDSIAPTDINIDNNFTDADDTPDVDETPEENREMDTDF